MIRFHLDEHASNALATALRRLGIDVTTTHDAGLSGALDQEHLSYCLETGRVMFTQDEDYLELHASGVAHAGIAYCHQRQRSLRELIDGLQLIWELLDEEDMTGRIEFL